MEYLAHISEDGTREQSIDAHLGGTAERCARFARAFDAEAQGYFTGLAHDIGKFSDAFQRRLRGGSVTDHATAGAWKSAKKGAEWSAFCIAGHHGGLPDGGSRLDDDGQATLVGRLKRAEAGKIEDFSAWTDNLPPVSAPQSYGRDPLHNAFFIRLLYSCLVDADWLDTEAFMANAPPPRGGYDTLQPLLQRLNAYTAAWESPANELNRQRLHILHTCCAAAERPRGLYTLTVPTGGGKTVSSLAFALRHAIANGMDRIIYIVPYCSIIEQNAEVFRRILGTENVLEHHSGVLYDVENSVSDYRHALASENFDMPVVVTTAVQFFESLYANRSSPCRKVHNLANAVLIFDEAQMLPIEHLRPCVSAIAELVAQGRSTAVLCTATQPSLGALFHDLAPQLHIQELCPSADAPVFRRVRFRREGKLGWNDLAAQMTASPQALCVVNSRAGAQALYQALPPESRFHLSTLMCPAHRRAVLREIRQRLDDKLPCYLVSTSLIEAGVDIDFPAVWRELAGLDSILQAAGRCNRNGRRPAAESIVTIFEAETPPPKLFQPNLQASAEALRQYPDPASPQAMDAYFQALLDMRSGSGLDKYGVIDAFRMGVAGCAYPFRTVAEQFHLIDNCTKTVYLPYDAESRRLLAALREGTRTRELFRALGRYGVAVYEQHYAALRSAGDIEELDGDTAVLRSEALYDAHTGLSLKADFGKAEFV